jgi:PAS domain S-box-containing protein
MAAGARRDRRLLEVPVRHEPWPLRHATAVRASPDDHLRRRVRARDAAPLAHWSEGVDAPVAAPRPARERPAAAGTVTDMERPPAAAAGGRTAIGDTRLVQQMVDATLDYAIASMDVEGRIVSWNKGAQHLDGYRPEEVLGAHVSCLYRPEDAAAGKPDRDLAIAVADGHLQEETWRIRKDGTTYWASIVITALRGEDGRLLGFGQMVRDLSERKRGEDALRESEERFRLLVGGVRDYAIFLLEPDGTIASWNSGAERLKGYRADEIIGRHFSTFYTEADRRERVPDRGLQCARDEGRWESEGWRVRKDGTRFWASVVISSLTGSDGRHRGFAKVTRDLTERKRNEDALRGVLEREREASARLREIDRMRSELVAVVAHDLRAPVGVIQSLVHLLLTEWETWSDQEKLEALRRASTRTETLAGLVDDVFDLARIDAGQLTTDSAPMDLESIVHQVVADLRTMDADRRVSVDVDPSAARALGDERRTWQVLSNLVSNAVKFSPAVAPVEIAVWREEDAVVVAVTDHGAGIPEDQHATVFERFTRLPAAKGTPGSGIGLFIARSLVEAQGGRISLESAPGLGSTFRFTLPVGA